MAIWTYTHIKGARASIDGMQASHNMAVNITPYYGRWKRKAVERAPTSVQTGLNFAVHGLCGVFYYIKSYASFLLHSFSFLSSFYRKLVHILNRRKNGGQK